MKIEFEIPNLFTWIKKKIAWGRYKKKLAKDIDYLISEVNKNPDQYHSFKWTHLVVQEIGMWIRMGKQVSQEEFNFICDRRGFDSAMIRYLFGMMKHVGYGKLLHYIPDSTI